MISLRNLEKSFRNGAGETFVLRRITLDVKPGEFVSVMGPSGAGKSTLLHILGMHDTEWRGEYELHNQPVHSLKQKRAMVASPNLILADEPTGNLHSDQAREIMELFKKLNGEGTTIVQVTHSETNAQYGDRIIKLRDGWLVND